MTGTPVTTLAVRIGITGHSDLTPASVPLVAAALRRWLSARADPPPWVGVSCLAAGSDQLFAGLVLGLGGHLEVILPAADYRARKVAPADAVEFDRLRAAASEVTVLTAALSGRAAYVAANHALLAAVGMVVAVWDGQPARRPGSTGDVVAAARRRGLPVSVLWPTGAARQPPPPSVPPARAGPGPQVAVVLAGLLFPAQRWQIVMFAEHYGADRITRELLDRLPNGGYPNLAAVTATLTRRTG